MRNMDSEGNDFTVRRSGSWSRTNSVTSSRRHSSRLSNSYTQLDDAESDSVSEVGDIGDRIVHSNRHSDSGRNPLANVAEENGIIVPVSEDISLQPIGNWSRDPSTSNTGAPSLLTTHPILTAGETKKENEKEISWLLDYVLYLVFLAIGGILGVLTRFGLQKLFGPEVIGATSDQSYMYLDLPSNMVGSYLMGWFGVVFKKDIADFSNHLAIGITTGFLGSLTTFSGWNQKMLQLSVEGHWVFTVLGILVGLFLVAYSIIFGIETARGVKWLCMRSKVIPVSAESDCQGSLNGRNRKQHLKVLVVVLMMVLGGLLSMSGLLENKEFKDGGSKAQLWLACIVGPFGVWIRWYLARLNGRGLGKSGSLKWVPFGTLIANITAACVMAGLASLKMAVKTKTCDTIATGIQFGLLGCLSTVSTFIAEFHAMRESKYPWRAYVYAMSTQLLSFLLGTLIYSTPVWSHAFD